VSRASAKVAGGPGGHLIGLVAFLVPQEETSFTLVLLPSDLNGATSQAAIPFQIP